MALERLERLGDPQIEDLHRLFQLEWWSRGRELGDVRRMVEQSSVVVALGDAQSKRLLAFARALTDFVYKAVIFDVIVDASRRREGLGRALMEAIVQDPKLRAVRHLELYCLPELEPFYRKWDFSDVLGGARLLRRST